MMLRSSLLTADAFDISEEIEQKEKKVEGVNFTLYIACVVHLCVGHIVMEGMMRWSKKAEDLVMAW